MRNATQDRKGQCMWTCTHTVSVSAEGQGDNLREQAQRGSRIGSSRALQTMLSWSCIQGALGSRGRLSQDAPKL